MPRNLFVKFSRNFQDPVRDANKHHMRAEIRLAALSREPVFPITVPLCLFTDFEAATQTGILITERIAYGKNGIEPLIYKCMDHLLPDALSHYRAIIVSLGCLAGAHKAGKLGPVADRDFPLDTDRFVDGDRNPYDPDKLSGRVQRLASFVAEFPQLFPEAVADARFLAGFVDDAPLFLKRESAIKQWLHANTDFIALCHWNANIDNGWFWRDAGGNLRCGLIDWGSVGQINLGMALWGCLSAAEPALWNDHLVDLLDLFVMEYAANGGPEIAVRELMVHLDLFVMMMGLASLMEAPWHIRSEIPDPSLLEGPNDPVLARHELARIQLKITANMLNLWQRHDLGAYLRAGGNLAEAMQARSAR